MNKDQIRYIMNYHSNLMTKQERLAWRHWSTTYKIDSSETSTKEQKEKRRKHSYKLEWLTKDEEVLKLLKDGIDSLELSICQRILTENVIAFNLCPQCGKLARTPKAKQCRFCGHDWH